MMNTDIPSYLIFRIIVWKWCVRSCFLQKNGGQQRSSAAIFPQKAAPHTSLSHYNTKYQISRNSRILNQISFHIYISLLFSHVQYRSITFSLPYRFDLVAPSGKIWFCLP